MLFYCAVWCGGPDGRQQPGSYWTPVNVKYLDPDLIERLVKRNPAAWRWVCPD